MAHLAHLWSRHVSLLSGNSRGMAVSHQVRQRPCLQSHHWWSSTPRLPRCRKLPPVPGAEWVPGYTGAELLFKATPVCQSHRQWCQTPCSLCLGGLAEGWPTYGPGATGSAWAVQIFAHHMLPHSDSSAAGCGGTSMSPEREGDKPAGAVQPPLLSCPGPSSMSFISSNA